MVEFRSNVNAAKLHKQSIEGPTPKQARKMAQTRQDFLARARELVEAGGKRNQLAAAELDFDAWDIEMDLNRFGFDPDTGEKKS